MKNEKELRKLKRVDLLEMLLEQGKELERVKAQLERAENELRSREILLSRAGSIAEAAMQLNDIFAVAQKTADQYLDNIKRLYEEGQARENPEQNECQCANELAEADNKLQSHETDKI